jgi:hypothetical protein
MEGGDIISNTKRHFSFSLNKFLSIYLYSIFSPPCSSSLLSLSIAGRVGNWVEGYNHTVQNMEPLAKEGIPT